MDTGDLIGRVPKLCTFIFRCEKFGGFPNRRKDAMGNNFSELSRQAENAVRGIRDKELRREAFKILFLNLISADGNGGAGSSRANGRRNSDASRTRSTQINVTRKANPAQAAKRPGRRGGGVATVAIQKLIDGGAFKTGRDAAGIMRELAKKRVVLQPSQLRMVLLRFARSRKLKRRIKMKGKKVTYLYSVK
jgi:hypothetical protein